MATYKIVYDREGALEPLLHYGLGKLGIER